ncbi:MAG: hypothetical protein RLO52_30990 [Sandaracinaceae bacterium]
MQRKLLIIAAAASFGALFSHQAMAQGVAPAVLPMQGFLTDGDGAPIDGDTSIEVNLYDGDVSPTVLFTETQTVMVDQGHFTAYVGDGGGALDLALFRDNADVWVGIAIEGGTELPRFQLGSVPYAGFAQYSTNAQNLAGMPATDFQARVTGTCAPGQAITAIAGDGTVTCSPTGDITGVAAGVGLMGGGAMGDVTLNVNPAAVQTRVTGTCGAGEAIVGVNVNGTVTCASVGDILGVTAGTGLTGGGASGTVTLDVDTTTIQSRVTGSCPVGQAIRAVAPDGTVTCESAGGAGGWAPPLRIPFMPATAPGTPNPTAPPSGSTTSTTNVFVGTMFLSQGMSDTGLRSSFTRARLQVVCDGAGVLEVTNGATVLGSVTCSDGFRPWTASSTEFTVSSSGNLDLQVRATSGTLFWANPAVILY